jgi:hypothetical protein
MCASADRMHRGPPTSAPTPAPYVLNVAVVRCVCVCVSSLCSIDPHLHRTHARVFCCCRTHTSRYSTLAPSPHPTPLVSVNIACIVFAFHCALVLIALLTMRSLLFENLCRMARLSIAVATALADAHANAHANALTDAFADALADALTDALTNAGAQTYADARVACECVRSARAQLQHQCPRRRRQLCRRRNRRRQPQRRL